MPEVYDRLSSNSLTSGPVPGDRFDQIASYIFIHHIYMYEIKQ